MSRAQRFPRIHSGAGQETVEHLHSHSTDDITGDWDDVTVTGSLRSANWDGGGDLSAGRDTVATAGFLLDAVSGRAQFKSVYADGGELRTLTVAGTLTLSGSGAIVTAATGQRVELAAGAGAGWYGVRLYSGLAGETAGYLYAADSGDPAGLPETTLASPVTAGHPNVTILRLKSGNLAELRASLSPDVNNTYSLGTNIGTGAEQIWATVQATAFKGYAVQDETGTERLDLSACKGQAFTPTLTAATTNPTLGNGAAAGAVGYYYRLGKMVWGWVKISFDDGGTPAAEGDGHYIVALPVAADTTNMVPGAGTGMSIGNGRLWDDSGSDTWLIDVHLSGSQACRLRYDLQTAAGAVAHNAPFTWDDNDWITFCFQYVAA